MASRSQRVGTFSGPRLVLVALLGLCLPGVAVAQDVEENQPTAQQPQRTIPASKPQTREPREKPASQTKKPLQTKGQSPPDAVSKPVITAQPAPAPSPPPAPLAPQSVGEPIGELEPVIHARNAKITTCMDKIVSLSARVIDRPHGSVSTYVAAAPNDHVFQSIIGLSYPNKSAPNGAAIVLAAPINGSRCEGETVQIYPTANSCSVVQASLINSGQTLTTLQALPLLQTKDGNRELLMPTSGGGCVVISIGLR